MTPATTLAAALETALDTYLKQDPQALRRCTALEGKVIGLDITGLKRSSTNYDTVLFQRQLEMRRIRKVFYDIICILFDKGLCPKYHNTYIFG